MTDSWKNTANSSPWNWVFFQWWWLDHLCQNMQTIFQREATYNFSQFLRICVSDSFHVWILLVRLNTVSNKVLGWSLLIAIWFDSFLALANSWDSMEERLNQPGAQYVYQPLEDWGTWEILTHWIRYKVGNLVSSASLSLGTFLSDSDFLLLATVYASMSR